MNGSAKETTRNNKVLSSLKFFLFLYIGLIRSFADDFINSLYIPGNLKDYFNYEEDECDEFHD